MAGRWPTKHHTGTKGQYIADKWTIYGRQSTTQRQSMANKEPHSDKMTIYGRQSTIQGQKDNLWPTKHHTGTKGQSMADKAPHRDKRTICCRQSTT